jgi:phosphoribosylglycinamide formyltransferase-1
MMRLVALASNNGSAMRAVQKAIDAGELDAELVLVISNRASAPALTFAQENAIAAKAIKDEAALVKTLKAAKPDFIILSGYLRKIPSSLLKEKIAPIINIHPSLLPKYGGKGMFGIHVHKAVLAAKEKWTGATTHFVNENYDEGETIRQKRVKIQKEWSAETLAQHVMKAEETLMVETLQNLILEKKST